MYSRWMIDAMIELSRRSRHVVLGIQAKGSVLLFLDECDR